MKAKLLKTGIPAIIIAWVFTALFFIFMGTGTGNTPSPRKGKAETVLVSKIEEAAPAPERRTVERCSTSGSGEKGSLLSWPRSGLSIGLPLQW